MLIRIVLVAILLILPARLTVAQDEKLKDVKGTIRAIDLKTGSLHMQLLYADRQQPFNLGAKELPVFDAIGRPLKLADLRTELRIAAKVRGDDEIAAIHVDGPHRHGTVKKVDVPGRILIVKDPIAEKVISVPVEAKVVALGADYPFEKLKVGDLVQVTYSVDGKTVLKVQTGKGTHMRDPFLRITRYFGIITELDKSKSEASIMVQSIDAGIIKTYPISPSAYLRMMYHTKPVKEISHEQLGKWVKAHYFVNRDTGSIVNIDAELPVLVRRKVVSIDREAKTLTVEDELKEKKLNLASDVRIWTPKGEGRLAEIAAGRIVNCALTLDRGQVQLLYLWDR
ncbi:MAG: hypothetical protein EXS16_01515 [Gemmataceae bacterium]|nr:hypothetical protein [Gemmataceae bacterium]